MELRLALCSLLTLAALSPAQNGAAGTPAPATPPPAAQDPDKPTPKPADLINDLTREKDRLQSEIEFARNRAKNATKALADKLVQRGQKFRGIDAGTNVVAPSPAMPMKKARLMSPEEAKGVGQDVMLTVNGQPVRQFEFDELMTYLRTSPATGDDSVRSQRILFDLIRVASVAAAFPENEAEGQLGDALAQLEKGSKIADLAKSMGTVQGADEQGRIEVTRNSFLGPKAEQVAFSVPAGQRSRPFRSAQGYVVLEVESVEKGASPELDKVIARALQIVYQADPTTLQRAQAAAASGQVDIAVRDQQVLDMLPALFRPAPATPDQLSDSEAGALDQRLTNLRLEAAKLEGTNDEGGAERLKQVLQEIAELESVKQQVLDKAGSDAKVPPKTDAKVEPRVDVPIKK
jgi:parvulin-like peptidyl-prolyl isomerase